MHNLQINFNYPWFLLLLIPAVILTLMPYLKISKRHRRTRNRVVSVVLHLTVMVLCILALCGMNFSYQVPNDENEILLLVDVSDSEEQAVRDRDAFVELVLQDSQYDGYKVGVATFGYDQVYAVPFTYDVDSIYDEYLLAAIPDTTATNIASALRYAKELFSNEQSAKIVLITDGKETDEEAALAIRNIAAEGIKIDVALVPSQYPGEDVQITSVDLPEYYTTLGEEYSLFVTLQSKGKAEVSLELLDNGEAQQVVSTQVDKGTQSVAIPFTFSEEGLHELLVKLTVKGEDALTENNIYYTYRYVEAFNKLLVLQRAEGESEKFVAMINAANEYDITVKTISASDIPSTVTELCQYDQVVLNNIANADMPRGFIDMLNIYVKEYGGGLFTVGGDKTQVVDGKEKAVANAYSRTDMYNTLYQQMLPVEAVNYTPPLGVMVLMDVSGSMHGDAEGGTKLDWAKAGVDACLDALNVRDYIGVLAFDDYADAILELTPRTQEAKIKEALNTIKDRTAGGGTVVGGSLMHAAQVLAAQKDIAKRHIIIVTDGVIASADEVIAQAAEIYEKHGITISVVGIGIDASAKKTMEQLVEVAHGRLIFEDPGEKLVAAMREELNVQPLKEVEEGEFNPSVYDALSPLVRNMSKLELEDGSEDLNKLAVTLDGFYGVKARSTADLILVGDYDVPIYAQWKYGEGMVGSFMCDLQGIRSAKFMASPDGALFIKNVINNLMPTEDIRPKDIKVSLKEDNYTNKISVELGTPLSAGETLKGAIYNTNDELLLDLTEVTNLEDYSSASCYVTSSMNSLNKFSRADFVLKEGGVYKIVITRHDAQGEEISKVEVYKSFAYSEEYNSFAKGPTDEMTAEEFAEDVAERGNGKVIADLENPFEIFEGFVTDLDKNFDPRMIFLITAIVLFLLDVAVRKFKFKWPHEIIQAIKKKKENDKN